MVLCSGLRGRFWVDFGGGLARGGLQGGSWWVSRWVWVTDSGNSHFWWIPMVLGEFFFVVLFYIVPKHTM